MYVQKTKNDSNYFSLNLVKVAISSIPYNRKPIIIYRLIFIVKINCFGEKNHNKL